MCRLKAALLWITSCHLSVRKPTPRDKGETSLEIPVERFHKKSCGWLQYALSFIHDTLPHTGTVREGELEAMHTPAFQIYIKFDVCLEPQFYTFRHDFFSLYDLSEKIVIFWWNFPRTIQYISISLSIWIFILKTSENCITNGEHCYQREKY